MIYYPNDKKTKRNDCFPATSPSSPSIQFKALVIETIQNNVNKNPSISPVEMDGNISLKIEKFIDLNISP